jgi:hypothetical protein
MASDSDYNTRIIPALGGYQAKTTRRFPVFVLTRRDEYG